ncbi:HEAT repeat domain-containing protein [Novipirellula artificiosorum]|uniref:PBS lyase HEAT-like repeat protein n=1 Tax=Novipirellula artificiosorum TaxID=2528016 RepID=A0A5C6DYL8_9BACT|nr:HEAT repeat domain-containing protein [Novipirellula artificiosorum]TWU40501.1 PBS lyase HEAT-like repeat protein [Novipirellula artificiosorum]
MEAIRERLVYLVMGLVIFAVNTAHAEGFPEQYDLAMDRRPTIPESQIAYAFPDGLKDLWTRGLDQPDAELQRMLIDTLAIAHQQGLSGMTDATPKLLALLQTPGQEMDVLVAAAQTLVILDAKDHAATLANSAMQYGPSLSQIVEPAIAAWKSPVMLATWIERIESGKADQRMLALAIDGLGKLQATEATNSLERLLFSVYEPTSVRMSAARALGRIHHSGMVEVADRLIQLNSTSDDDQRLPELNPLLAIEVLANHDDVETVTLMNLLASHPSTPVQSRALGRLYEIDPELVDPHIDRVISSRDVNVRRWCALSMIDQQAIDRIKTLAPLMQDINPGLRRDVALGLIRLAALPNLTDEVIERTRDVMNQHQWQGCEQACFVMAKLDYKPSGSRMVELLGHPRGEVRVASAWGLTQLRLSEWLPDMLEHAQRVYDGFRSGEFNDDMRGYSLQQAHLFIAFGDQMYRPADALMRNYLPKRKTLGHLSRPAAAWALGLLYEDDPQEDLITILEERLNDVDSMDPESLRMRSKCAITLGRMNAESALESLRSNANSCGGCYWAIERITGEPAPDPGTFTTEIDGWVLEPLTMP